MDDTPVYNLKAVVLETGLKPDTLRAWERRYGLPTPNRSDGGHRLYSERDIQVLKWLVARQQAGLSISRAAELWQRLSESGQDPAEMPEYAPAHRLAHAPLMLAGQALEDLRSAWVQACLAFDEQRAEAALNQALAQSPVENVGLGLLVPGLAEIGDLWYRGQASPQQEHFASELALRRIESLLAATPSPVRDGRILVACPPEEQHTFMPLLLTLLLRRRGWAVTYLGANVPAAQFEEALDSVRPHLCLTSAQTLHAAAQILSLAEILQTRGIPLAFGGTAFAMRPSLARRIPGHALGNQLEDSLDVIESLLASPPPAPGPPAIEPALRGAQQALLARRPHIEAQLLAQIPESVVPAAQLHTGLDNLSQAILDGLVLGDLDLVAPELSWVEGLMAHAHVPTERLTAFLDAYARAVAEHLGPQGKPVVEWLDRQTSDRPTGAKEG
ncbi:MAG: MerR family transcriptional regulator [Chloroflexi bacterium]|nr:MerR family transcriptional regulator [Chloroflexota bacterium]